jgi:hypothetical protein
LVCNSLSYNDKPFDVLAEGLLLKNSRGDKTAIELFVVGIRGWARPKIFTRSFFTGKEDYDPVKLGWKITVLDEPADSKLLGIERRKIYDTTLPGRGNAGHAFGDDLTEPERLAVIEYLKTL